MEPRRDDIETDRQLVGYPTQWLTSGWLDTALLREQAEHRRGPDGDESTEHYRFAAFLRVLETDGPVDDRWIDCYVELCLLDPDPGMGHSALHELVRRGPLSDAQLVAVLARPECAAPSIQKLGHRRQLERRMEASEVLDAELFQSCLTGVDRQLQHMLFGHPGLTLEHCRVLAEQGSTKAIRNRAAAELRMAERRAEREAKLRARGKLP
jgi:hypothetical protein